MNGKLDALVEQQRRIDEEKDAQVWMLQGVKSWGIRGVCEGNVGGKLEGTNKWKE